MNRGLQNYGWLLVVVSTVCVYVWSPVWPHAMAPMPWWPFSPIFSALVVLTAFYLKGHLSVGSIVLGTAAIALCLYFEDMFGALAFAAAKGRLVRALTENLVVYLVVPTFYVLLNLPVVAAFAVSEFALAALNRSKQPAAIGQ